jgi:hypothetical protein
MTNAKAMIRGTLAALLTCLCFASAQAAENSKQRVRAFAALPDWTGFWNWKEESAVQGTNGDVVFEEIPQLMARTQLAAPPPYNASWNAQYSAHVAAQMALRSSGRADATSKGCWFGFPVQMETLDDTFQVMITPEETMIVFERLAVRHIYTDGRMHPRKEDLWPTTEGDSIGHWEGDTLVVDTVARKAGPIGFFAPASALSDQAHFIERIRMNKANELEDQMTIEDPVAFVHPWQVTIGYGRATGVDRFIGYDCENDRNPIVSGRLTIAAPSLAPPAAEGTR